MLKITRFVKKDKLFDLFNDINIGNLKMYTSLNKGLRDKTVVKVDIYLRIPKKEFYEWIDKYSTIGRNRKNNTVVTTLKCAKYDSYLKASAFDDFGEGYYPSDTMVKYMKFYTQDYFWNL